MDVPAVRNDEAGNVGRHILELTTVSATTTVTYANFFDNPYNKAMYLVLPIMVFIYGGCGAIYCVAKLRRYAKRKRRERLVALNSRPDSNSTVISPFIVDINEDDDMDEFVKPRKKKPVFSTPIVDMVGKKNVGVVSPPFDEPPPYSPEPKAGYMNSAYMQDDYSAPTIHVFQQPDSPEVPRSAPTSRTGIIETREMTDASTLDPFHMPRPKKKKRLVFIAI